MIGMFPSCCGLRILSNVPVFYGNKDAGEYWKQWFMKELSNTSSYGPVDTLVVLNAHQEKSYGKYFRDFGFELLTDKIYNPVHAWNTLYLYLWSASRNHKTWLELKPTYTPELPENLIKGE